MLGVNENIIISYFTPLWIRENSAWYCAEYLSQLLFKEALNSVMRSIGVVLLVGAAFFVKGNLGSSNRGKRCEYYVHHKPYATVVKSEPD